MFAKELENTSLLDYVDVICHGLHDDEVSDFKSLLHARKVLLEITPTTADFFYDFKQRLSLYFEPYTPSFFTQSVLSKISLSRVLLLENSASNTIMKSWFLRAESIGGTAADLDRYYIDPHEQIAKALSMRLLSTFPSYLSYENSQILHIENHQQMVEKGENRIQELGWEKIVRGIYATNHEGDFAVAPSSLHRGTLKVLAMSDISNSIIFLQANNDTSFDPVHNIRNMLSLSEELTHLFLENIKYSFIGETCLGGEKNMKK